MRTSHIYTYVIAAVLGAGLSVYVHAGCGACGGDAGHTHAKKAAVKTQTDAKAVCQACTADKKPCKACPVAATAKAKAAKAKAVAHAVKTVTTDQLANMIEKNETVVVLDARSGKYDDGRRIPGAKSLNAKSTPEEVAAVVGDKDTKIVTYCSGVKCPASGYLAKHLTKLGYKNVIEYPEGIAGWAESGKKVEKAN